MPRKPIKFENTIIYKIVCNDLSINETYVGHTTSFTKRKTSHKSAFNRSSSLKVYEVIRANGGWDNWVMLEIEKFPCGDLNEALARERYWYEKLKSKLNANKPCTSDDEKVEYHKQYNIINKTRQNNACKDYYKLNKEAIDARKREYEKVNKERLSEERRLNREPFRKQLAEKAKLYRNINKIKLSEAKNNL